jgi:FkbM family methyltransferase
MSGAPVAAVRDPALTLSTHQLRRSEELARRLDVAHRFCRGVNVATNLWFCPTLVRKACARLARKLSEAWLPPLDDEGILTPTIYGFTLCVSRRSGANYYYQGFYEAGTLAEMARTLRPGDVFVDAGASVGQMSMMASQLVGDDGLVLAFEPHPGRFRELTNTVAANHARNVVCFPCGLSDEASGVALYTDRVSPSMVAVGDTEGASEQTTVARLDDILAANSIDRVRMLKVDVEGFELKVLQGAVGLLDSDAPPVLCVEHGVYDAEPFPPFIERLGRYRFFQLRRGANFDSRLQLVPDAGRLRGHDNVFCVPAEVSVDGSPTPAVAGGWSARVGHAVRRARSSVGGRSARG